MGLLALAVAFFLRRREAFLPALTIILVAGVSAWPVYVTGSEAYKPVRRIADDVGIDWLDAHMDRADLSVWVFYVMAGVAALALIFPRKWPDTARPLAFATVFMALSSLGVAAWIADAGGKIRHPEIRPTGEIPPTIEVNHEH